MKADQTICYKVDRLNESIKRAVNTMEFDPVGMLKLLEQIRRDATHMEEALRLRKASMEEAGIEEAYQKKGKAKPDAKNKIATEEEHKIGREVFEVTILREGEVVYQHTAHAGALSLVEEIQDIDEYGVITGTTQKLTFGHPLGYWFAFNQLEQAVQSRNMEIMASIGAMMKNGKMDKESRELVMKALNHMNIEQKGGETI